MLIRKSLIISNKMTEPTIPKLNELIQSRCKKGQTVESTKITRLTAPGENYGSLMLKVDAVLKNADNSVEDLHLVAKCLPESEFFKEVFNVKTTVKNEIAFYKVIIPALQALQREHGIDDVIDCFPKLYAERLNLKSDSDEVDDNAVLLMENVSVQGYRNIDRHVGFSLEDAKLVLKDLATLHAASLALKLQKPKLFEEIKKYCSALEPPPAAPDNSNMKNLCLSILEDDEECKPYLSSFRKIFDENTPFGSPKDAPEPFITISHNDMWSNNTMQIFEEGKATTNIFIDFQSYQCDTPAKDLVFLLWSSCQFNVLKDHVDELIEYYHQHFILTLKSLNCDTEPFSFDKFMKEIDRVSKQEMMHLSFFLPFVIFGKKNEAMEPGKVDKKQHSKNDVAAEAKNRLCLLIKYNGKRGVLQ